MEKTVFQEIARVLVPQTFRHVPRWTAEEQAALKSWQEKIDARRRAQMRESQ